MTAAVMQYPPRPNQLGLAKFNTVRCELPLNLGYVRTVARFNRAKDDRTVQARPRRNDF